MLKRFLLCAFLLTAAFRAGATDYTDIWYLPAESGWGVNVVQSDDFLFVTFFIYGADGKPTWYTAQLKLDASGNYNGNLYATLGTFYASPWKPADQITTVVGTASFQPTSPYTAKFVYVVTTPAPLAATVTKLVQRQSLPPLTIGGTYNGVAIVTTSGCAQSGRAIYDIDTHVTQTTDGSPASLDLTYVADGFSCTFSGSLTLWGKLYQIAAATYTCSDGTKTTAKLDEINATPHGLEFLWTAPLPGGSCTESGTYSGVLNLQP